MEAVKRFYLRNTGSFTSIFEKEKENNKKAPQARNRQREDVRVACPLVLPRSCPGPSTPSCYDDWFGDRRRGRYALILGALAGVGIEWFWTSRSLKKTKERHNELSNVGFDLEPSGDFSSFSAAIIDVFY